jgi:hypothetical protein
MTSTSIKHKLLSEAIVKHNGDKVTAYRKIYPSCSSDESARVAVSRAMQNNPSIKEGILAVLDRQGITEDKLTGKLASMLEATKDIVTGKGEVVVCRDNTSQLVAMQTGLKLHGHLGNGGTNIDARSVTINQVADVKVEALASIVADLKAMRTRSEADSGGQSGDVNSVESIRPDVEK